MEKTQKAFITVLLIFLINVSISFAQKSDANIFGHVLCCGNHIPFATISIKGTTIGTTTDETGHYQLINLPPGKLTIQARALGYKTQEIEITLKPGETKILNFDLEQDILNLEEIVVTANRNQVKRKEASNIVNIITPKLFSTTNSISLGECLNFTPGMRIEDNCQNCGVSQVRLNGLPGSYSQILINNRPIINSLTSLFILDFIPTNMIERIEVIRGSSSALYGSNAVAGTINIILKEPKYNSYEFSINSRVIGINNYTNKPAQEYSVSFNSSVISTDNKTSMAIFGTYRDRQPFDANNDNFSEIPLLKNTTIGTHLTHRFGKRNKITFDFFNIREKRRGGDKFDNPPHLSNIAEDLTHNLNMGNITFNQYFRQYDILSLYLAGQKLDRNSYSGAGHSLQGYNNIKSFNYVFGIQYNAIFKNSNLILGFENIGESLKDIKNGYPDINNAIIENGSIISIPYTDNTLISLQKINTIGIFAQYEIKFNQLKITTGLRYDKYNIRDLAHFTASKTGEVLIPRLAIKYNIKEYLQARISYSQGYRAPQIFDEDLHFATSGSRQIIFQNSPDLVSETSKSITTSLNFNKLIGNNYIEFLTEAFYTRLENPFANRYSLPDENGIVIYTRVNSEGGAVVKGINLEFRMMVNNTFSLNAGYTKQSSMYDLPQEFNERRFFRTPNDYGYIIFDWFISKKINISYTTNYTGKMLVPYFGPQLLEPEQGELRTSQQFFDLGIKIQYNIKFNGGSLQLITGIKNILNSYQKDFDIGINRDPEYIYGPIFPRTIYFGIKIGNLLK